MFTKHSPTPGAASWEAAGLRWLASFGVIPVVEVLGVEASTLRLERLTEVPASREAAETLGRRLAALHHQPVAGYGVPPDGWQGDGCLGPNDDLLPQPLGVCDSWVEHWAEQCLRPVAQICVDRGRADASLLHEVDACVSRLQAHDTGEPASPVHGDLWAGNVVWTPEGATLIDPSAHGGHREMDLALLQLFGFPHLQRVLAAYDEAHTLADGWQDRVRLHQAHHLLVHVACFGGGYLDAALRALRAG